MDSSQSSPIRGPAAQLGGVYRDLLDWSLSLPRWQQELLRRVVSQSGISSEEIEELAVACIAEAEQQPSPYHTFSDVDLPTTVANSAPSQLLSLDDLHDVNALLSGQSLSFGSQLTVVYGDNASGKSGYARVLKKVYRARVVEDILADLGSEKPSINPARAKFMIKDSAGIVTQVDWEDGTPLSNVGRFSVLDSKCSQTYMRREFEG